MIERFSLVAACCLCALLLAACGGGDANDDLGMTIVEVSPTRSADALSDFALLPALTPLPVAAPSQTPVPPPPTATPLPPTQAPPLVQASPPPPAPTAASTPVIAVLSTPGAGNTFTFQPGAVSGGPVCGLISGSALSPAQITSGNQPPGVPPTGASQVGAPAGGDTMAGLAGLLGISPAQLQSELGQQGASQATVAARHGKSRDQLKSFLTEQTRKLFAEQVSAGRMTQAQARQLLQQFSSDVDKVIDASGACGPIAFSPGQGR